MRVELSLKKSLEENAAEYFDKAKKAKSKLKKAREKHGKFLAELEKLQKNRDEFVAEQENKQEARDRMLAKKKWYHKFRWFISSEGLLVVGGRDATTNDILIKKHAEPEDLVFHTDMRGSPFFVIKSQGKKPGKDSMQEAADATCTFSRAWRMGLTSQQVFYVKPDQCKKENLPKGAFLIVGKTNYIENKLNMAVGLASDGFVMGGPLEAVKKNCKKHVEIIPGDDKASAVAKKIKAVIGGDLDEIIRVLPSGGMKFKKQNK